MLSGLAVRSRGRAYQSHSVRFASSVAGALALIAVCQPGSLFAQDLDAPLRLEELIPDEAVENPEEWAADGAPRDAAIDREDIDPDSPLATIPAIGVPWPTEADLPQLAPLQPLEAEDDIRFTELELPGRVAPTEIDLVTLSQELALAFPAGDDAIAVQDEFVGKFEALSKIEELESDEQNVAQLAAQARADQTLLTDLLQAYGYYDAEIRRTVGSVQTDDDAELERPAVRFDILPGTRFTFGEVNLGALDTAPDYAALRASFEIMPGDPLDNFRIVEEQADLDRALGESGYPFAAIDAPELVVDHEDFTGDLTLPVQPGGKYVFGAVNSSLPDFLSSKHLAGIARFDEGDVYKRSMALDLRRAIIATGLASSVTVTPREVVPPSANGPGTVAMDIGLEKAPLRTIAGSIGYGTEEGFRVAASWEHRNLFPPEGALRLRGIAGTQEQLAGITFTKSNFGKRDRILTLDAYASTIDSDAFDARTIAASAIYERQSTLLFQKPVSYNVGLELVATQERPAAVNGVSGPRETFFVAAVPAGVLLDSTDDLLDPTEGFRLGGRISPEVSRNQGTQSFYVRSNIDASYYRRISEKIVVAGRTRLASIPGTGLQNIAPSRRIYAGGGGSVRGYGFQQIGPRDNLGEPSGGRSAVELAVEARIRTRFFDGAVSVVPFLDMGSVGRDPLPSFGEIKIGAGVGMRYHTGFGPIRVDVGVPLNPGPDDSPVAVYVSLGQAF
ncbi:hypothetical protein HME9302_00507 [Alteripontixanthobacter maritimus]|uniref:Bacterial surface antigen (D15) domain-containing protein n=1 Tax=Alteripontixanthobacter maritimus TaxID=2161824 RepID=A0A369Q4F5_9SPHN|nr:hypothetical protein HME9302_00507 [Alteripontixanthobacter maritimus]